MHTASYVIAVVLGLALMLGAGPAQAETINCTPITAVPIVITVQGVYCFTQNLATNMTSGNAIEIQANNVILDLNGWKLGGQAAGLGTGAFGIVATDRRNITLKNGTVRGFFMGISLTDSGSGASEGHVVEDIRADHNTFLGIAVQGRGILIRNNLVVATGGTTPNFAGNASAVGIYAAGTGPRVLNNDVIDTTKQGAGIARGILFTLNTSGGLAENNRITNADVGIEYNPASGKYSDNLTTADVPTPYVGGTDAGNNF
jgi:hypothetical protein